MDVGGGEGEGEAGGRWPEREAGAEAEEAGEAVRRPDGRWKIFRSTDCVPIQT